MNCMHRLHTQHTAIHLLYAIDAYNTHINNYTVCNRMSFQLIKNRSSDRFVGKIDLHFMLT